MSASVLLWYLASPYSHPSYFVRRERYEAAVTETQRLRRAGVHVFAPIVYGHHLDDQGADWRAWAAFDCAMIAALPRFAVLALPGWLTSEGVQAEVDHAESIGRRIVMVEPGGDVPQAMLAGA